MKHAVRLCGTGGIDAWGLSYHVDHAIHYSDVKWGPVPGVAAGCGRFKPNVIFVASTSGQIVAAIAASMTIVFK